MHAINAGLGQTSVSLSNSTKGAKVPLVALVVASVLVLCGLLFESSSLGSWISATIVGKPPPQFVEASSYNSIKQIEQTNCAPWVKSSQRKVLFIHVQTMRNYYEPGRSLSGEQYVFGSFDWALQQLGFTVDTWEKPVEKLTLEVLEPYYMIFKNGLEWYPILNGRPDIACRFRCLGFWGNFKGDPSNPWDPRQAIVPYRDNYNTFLGFFVHSLLDHSHPTPPLKREKKGFILGKNGDNMKHVAALKALIQDNFTIYSSCQSGHHCNLPPEVVITPRLAPQDYAHFMSEMAFLLGMGDPAVSPSPLVAMAHGTAFLNPIHHGHTDVNLHLTQKALQSYPLHNKDIYTQHSPIALLGSPYVYNIDLENTTSVVRAARWAVQHRFISYTPPDYRPEAMVARACGILEYNAICTCPKRTFGHDQDQPFPEDPHLDCHGNTNVGNVS